MSEQESIPAEIIKSDTFRTRTRPDKFKCSFETADAEFAKFQHYYELYADEMSAEELPAFQKASEKLIIAVQKGRLSFKEDGTFTQILASGEVVNYKALSALSKSQDPGISRPNESPEISRLRRMHSMMGSLSGLGYEAILQFEVHDMSVMECLAFLLLNV